MGADPAGIRCDFETTAAESLARQAGHSAANCVFSETPYKKNPACHILACGPLARAGSPRSRVNATTLRKEKKTLVFWHYYLQKACQSWGLYGLTAAEKKHSPPKTTAWPQRAPTDAEPCTPPGSGAAGRPPPIHRGGLTGYSSRPPAAALARTASGPRKRHPHRLLR